MKTCYRCHALGGYVVSHCGPVVPCPDCKNLVEETYEDKIAAFGGRFTGGSLVEPWQQGSRTMLREDDK